MQSYTELERSVIITYVADHIFVPSIGAIAQYDSYYDDFEKYNVAAFVVDYYCTCTDVALALASDKSSCALAGFSNAAFASSSGA